MEIIQHTQNITSPDQIPTRFRQDRNTMGTETELLALIHIIIFQRSSKRESYRSSKHNQRGRENRCGRISAFAESSEA